jgi:AcrR family transcriptional regulator
LPRQRNRRGSGALLREELIEAARLRLSECDTEAEISIRSIARAAGVSPQSFYLQFASLDEVLFEAYSREWERLRQHLAGLLDDAAPDLDRTARLLLLGQGLCGFGETYPTSLRAIFGVRGAPKQDWNPERLPGSGVVALFAEALGLALAETGAPAPPEEVFERTVVLIAGLYGLAILRINKPSFPWPPLDPLIDQAVRGALTSAAGPPVPGAAPATPTPTDWA